MGKGAALVPLFGAVLAACEGTPADVTGAAASGAPLAAAPSARRPARRYYFARTASRCEIYFQDGEERSEPIVQPCPEYMYVGERIRIAGKTCFLENRAQPEREKPVVCPDPLTRLEKVERGELK